VGKRRKYPYLPTEILIDRAPPAINVRVPIFHSVRHVSLSAPEIARPIERRRGVERRRPEPSELGNAFRPDDRRLGLGRRWEDWCRPIGPHRGSNCDRENLS
jgi:hypothetical protein